MSSWSGGSPPEIIVVDGGSQDDTRALARAAGAKVLSAAPGRARQLNAGARAARGRYFYFLHADTRPPDNLLRHLRAAARQKLPAAFPIRFAEEEQSRWLRLYAALSRLNVTAFRFGDQSLFVSRAAFLKSGGYREELSLLEGYDLAARLRRQAGGFVLLPGRVTTSARRYLAHGVCFTQLVYVLLFSLHQFGVGQAVLRRIYARAFWRAGPAG